MATDIILSVTIRHSRALRIISPLIFCDFLFHFHFFSVTLCQSACYLGGIEMFLFHSLPLSCVARSSFLARQPLLLGRSDAASYALIRYFLEMMVLLCSRLLAEFFILDITETNLNNKNNFFINIINFYLWQDYSHYAYLFPLEGLKPI